MPKTVDVDDDICANRHGGDDCSRAAHESILPGKAELRGRILSCIRSSPSTCEEIETLLVLKHQTASARISELKALGQVRTSGLRRATSSGRSAHVLEAVAVTSGPSGTA